MSDLDVCPHCGCSLRGYLELLETLAQAEPNRMLLDLIRDTVVLTGIVERLENENEALRLYHQRKFS